MYISFAFDLFLNVVCCSNAVERRVERKNIQNGARREVKSES